MIDLHTHILSGIDDGADSMETSIKMAMDAGSGGTTTVVATPHFMSGLYEAEPGAIVSGAEELNARLEERGIPVRILPGAEIALDIDTVKRLEAGQVMPLGGRSRYLLLELPFHGMPVYAEQVVFQLSSKGYVPVIAHPERNARVAENPGNFHKLVMCGALGQVNAGSILGEFGPQARKTAEILIKSGMAHVIASDAHSTSKRRCRLDGARKRVAQIAGEAMALRMTVEIPGAIVQNKEIDRDEPEAYRPAGRFFVGWGRR